MAKIQVDRGLLIGLGSGLLAALLGLVFFIGRETMRPDPAPALEAAPAPVPEAAQATVVPALQMPAEAPSEPLELEAKPSAFPAASLPPPARPRTESAQAPSSDSVKAAVTEYFKAIDQIQPGQLGGDPSATANAIVEALLKGDSTGLDAIIQQTEATRRRTASLTPPQPCALHHRESLVSLDEGLNMLRSMKQAVASSDADALTRLTEQANRMRTRSEALGREEQSLRQRYGLVHGGK